MAEGGGELDTTYDKNLKCLFKCLREFIDEESAKRKEFFAEDELSRKLFDEISKLESRVQESKMTIAFLGHSSAGKSTVLNSLMRRNLLPTSIGHTTSCPTTIESTDARASFHSCKLSPDSRDDLPNPSQDVLRFFLSVEDCKDTVLENKRLKLMDFPGWNSKSFENASLEIQKADAIVFVGDKAAGMDDKDLINFLKTMKESSKVSTKAVFLVFNKVDKVLKKSNETWEILQEKVLLEAEKILVTESGFLQSKKEVREATFALSATQAAINRDKPSATLPPRRSSDSIRDLEKALIRDAGDKRLNKVVCCGSRHVGKTTLCNLLLRTSLLPVSPKSANCWVVCRLTNDEQIPVRDGRNGAEQTNRVSISMRSLEDELAKTNKNFMTVQLARHLAGANTIGNKYDSLVDAMSSESGKFEYCRNCLGTAASVIIVVECDELENVRKQIESHVELIITERKQLKIKVTHQKVFLVVNLREASIKSKSHNELLALKMAIFESFSKLANDLLSQNDNLQRVFFMSLKNLSDEQTSASEFTKFEATIFEAAKSRYIELKVGILKEEIVRLAREFQNLCSEGLKRWLEAAQKACDKLETIKGGIGNLSSERKEFVADFLKTCRNSQSTPGQPDAATVLKTSEQKRALVKKFFNDLIASFRRKLIDSTKASALEHASDPSVSSFVVSLCGKAGSTALNGLDKESDQILGEITKKARADFRTRSPLTKLFPLLPAAGGLVAVVGGATAIGLGGAAFFVVLSLMAFAVQHLLWPSFKDEEKLCEFLEIFSRVWLTEYEKKFNEALKVLAKESAKKMKGHADETQASLRQFQKDFERLGRKVPNCPVSESNNTTFDNF